MTCNSTTGYVAKVRSIEDDIVAAIGGLAGPARSGKMITRSQLIKRLDYHYRANEIAPVLQSLINQGYVFTRLGEPKPKGRPPRLYRLTTFARQRAPKPEKATVMLAFAASRDLVLALREMAVFHGRSMSEEIRDRLIYTLGYHGEKGDD